MKVLGYFFGCLLIFVVTPLFRGYVFTELWSWFLVPLGAVPIGKAHALGISLLLWLATTAGLKTQLDTDKKAAEWMPQAVGMCLSYPAMGLAFGWIFKELM